MCEDFPVGKQWKISKRFPLDFLTRKPNYTASDDHPQRPLDGWVTYVTMLVTYPVTTGGWCIDWVYILI